MKIQCRPETVFTFNKELFLLRVRLINAETIDVNSPNPVESATWRFAYYAGRSDSGVPQFDDEYRAAAVFSSKEAALAELKRIRKSEMHEGVEKILYSHCHIVVMSSKLDFLPVEEECL